MTLPLKQFIKGLTNNGMEIPSVYDIGAYCGDWTQEMKEVLPDSKFHMFEANEEHAKELHGVNTGHSIVCLSAPGVDEVKFYSRALTGDSYLKENTRWYDGVAPKVMSCRTLDFVVESEGLTPPTFIKLDCQGAELDILDGAVEALKTVELIYTECPLMPYNAGAPNMGNYLDYMLHMNFVPVLIGEVHYLECIAIQCDILFMHIDAKDKYLYPTVNIKPFGI